MQCFVSGMAYVRYVSPDCAAFAVDRLHGFEYPIGFPLSVSFAKPGSQHSRSMVLLCCNGRCVFRRRAARRVRNEVAARSSLGRLRRSTTGRRRTEGSGCVYLTSECYFMKTRVLLVSMLHLRDDLGHSIAGEVRLRLVVFVVVLG